MTESSIEYLVTNAQNNLIVENGNIGIGTTSPEAQLQISTDDNTENLRISSNHYQSSMKYML